MNQLLPKINGETGEKLVETVGLLLRLIELPTLGRIDGVRPQSVFHFFSLNRFSVGESSSCILLSHLAQMAQYRVPLKWLVLLKSFTVKVEVGKEACPV